MYIYCNIKVTKTIACKTLLVRNNFENMLLTIKTSNTKSTTLFYSVLTQSRVVAKSPIIH